MVILLAVINSEINDSNNYKIAKYIIENIDQYDHVSAFGYLQSENVALNLQYDLQTSRKVIYTCMQYANQIEYIKQADDSHLIIIFSESGTYFKRAFSRAHPFKNIKNKPKIWLITSQKNMQLSYIDRYIRYECHNDYSSHPYPLIAISSIICFYYNQYLLKNIE